MATPTTTNLEAGFIARYSTKRQKQLSNPGDPDATTVNSTLITQAAQDAALHFEEKARENFDDSNVGHVKACISGVEYFLQSYESRTAQHTKDLREEFNADLEFFVMHNKKRFQGNSVLTNTSPAARDPYFSDSFFDDLRPKG